MGLVKYKDPLDVTAKLDFDSKSSQKRKTVFQPDIISIDKADDPNHVSRVRLNFQRVSFLNHFSVSLSYNIILHLLEFKPTRSRLAETCCGLERVRYVLKSRLDTCQ